jgi:putative aldouronate transport system substrate-binding protein
MLQYDSTRPETKEVLAFLRGWYEEGFIDPGFYTYGNWGEALEQLSTGKNAFMTGNPWHNFTMLAAMEITGENWVAMPNTPAGPEGKRGHYAMEAYFGSNGFRKGVDPEKVRALFRQLNWGIDLHSNWAEYQQWGELEFGGCFEEGVQYEWDNGELVPGPIDEVTHGWLHLQTTGFASGGCGLQYPDYLHDVAAQLLPMYEQPKDEWNAAMRFLLNDMNRIFYSAIEALVAIRDEALSDEYTWLPTPTMKEVWGDLKTREHEVQTKIIRGDLPLSAFDDWVEEWKADGGDQITEEVNEWKEAQG